MIRSAPLLLLFAACSTPAEEPPAAVADPADLAWLRAQADTAPHDAAAGNEAQAAPTGAGEQEPGAEAAEAEGAAAAGVDLAAAPLDVHEALRLALEASPEAEAARARVRAAREAEAGAGTIRDPLLVGGVEALPFSSPRDEEEWLVGLTFALPAPGQLGAESAVAAAQGDLAERALKTTLLEVDRDVRVAFAQAYAAQRVVELVAALESLHRERLELEQQVVDSGAGAPTELLDEQLAHVRAQSQRSAAERAARRARIGLDLMLPAAHRGRPLAGALEEAFAVPELDELLRRVDELPTVEEALAEARLARLRADLAESRRIPEVLVDLGWRERADGRSSLDAKLGVALPFGGRQTADARSERERAAVAEALSRARWREVQAELLDAHAGAVAARELHLRLDARLLPVAQRALDDAVARYETGVSTLREVLEARITFVELELEVFAAAAEYQAASARLAVYLAPAE